MLRAFTTPSVLARIPKGFIPASVMYVYSQEMKDESRSDADVHPDILENSVLLIVFEPQA